MPGQKEIFIGLVGGIGVDFDSVIYCLKNEFKAQQYSVEEIRISVLIKKIFGAKKILNEFERIEHYMNEGTKLRECCKNKGILSYLAIAEINKIRQKNKKNNNMVYLLRSFKRPEEVDVFRKIYGRNFILFSVHSSIESRKKTLRSTGKENSKINDLIEKDFNETDSTQKEYGQNVIKTFPKSHVFLNTDLEIVLQNSIKRFVDILFGHPFHTPTADERNMFVAKGMSLRSADLSRQVGAAIANLDGDIIATGCNDVPKFGGGLYEPDDFPDLRDFKFYQNKDRDEEKFEVVKNLLRKFSTSVSKKYSTVSKGINNILENETAIKDVYKKLDLLDTKITNTLEFGRPVHAEMESICDAARRGIKLKNSTLYCTTYPCHLCAKLILAVGIKRVVYIDPYPKSIATKLFEKVIVDSNNSKYKDNNQLFFDAFMGIAPRRYLHVFKQKNRMKNGNVKKSQREESSFYLKARNSIDYLVREIVVLKKTKDLLDGVANPDIKLSYFRKSFNEAQRKYKKLQVKNNKFKDKGIFLNLDNLAEEYFSFNMNSEKKNKN